MYLIEGEAAGFTSIPVSVYWAVVTLTTVGFGDITPATAVGQFMASIIMLMGYGIIAVPTGIVSVELAYAARAAEAGGRGAAVGDIVCTECRTSGHDGDARFCKKCGGTVIAILPD